jgi:hypothetical protein
MKLGRDGYFESCSIQGTWEYADGRLTIQYGPYAEEAFVRAVWDVERREKTIAISGLSNAGVPFWAKKI